MKEIDYKGFEDVLTPLDYIGLDYFDHEYDDRLFRMMSVAELSNIFADDWAYFVPMSEDNLDNPVEDYEGFSHFKSFCYRITKDMFNWYLGNDDLIVEFDRKALANLLPEEAKLLPYHYDKDGEDDYEVRLFAHGFDPLTKVKEKIKDTIKCVYFPNWEEETFCIFQDYFDLNSEDCPNFKVVQWSR